MDEQLKEEIPRPGMDRTAIVLTLISLVALASACSGSRDDEGIAQEVGPVDPGAVRIAATVVEVDTARSSRANDPCARHACHAIISIDSVLAYGSGFPRPLSAGERVGVRFAFTLEDTDISMPGLDDTYPGLEEGEAFLADARAHARLDSLEFVIYEYYPR